MVLCSMPWVCARKHCISAAVTFLGVSLFSFILHLEIPASVYPSRSYTPFCRGVIGMAYSMEIYESTQSFWNFSESLSPPLVSTLAFPARG